MRTDILLIAYGEYTDYTNAAFKVLKPFTMREAAEAFLAQWKPANAYQKSPYPRAFTAWLNAEGYIEDLDIHEVHVGSYGNFSVEDGMQDIQFAPEGAA